MGDRSASPTRERFVEAAVALIDRNGGAAGVTLRDIAHEVGCSPPNAYNWFSGLDELLTAALVRICADFLDRIRAGVPADGAPEEILDAAVRAYVEYAVDHPGRLNVYHFERLSGLGSAATDAGEAVGQTMGALLQRGSAPAMEPGLATSITAVLHRYLIGRLAEHITGREPVVVRDQTISDVVTETVQLHRALAEAWGQQ